MVVEELLPAKTATADPQPGAPCFAARPPTHVSVWYRGDAGSRTSAVAACMVVMGACGAEEMSYVDGKVFCLSANAPLKIKSIRWGN